MVVLAGEILILEVRRAEIYGRWWTYEVNEARSLVARSSLGLCTLVCYISPMIAHVRLLVEMHDVLYILDTSIENPRSMVGQRVSQWISPTLRSLPALRCWFVSEVYHGEAAIILLLGLTTWSPGVGVVYKT